MYCLIIGHPLKNPRSVPLWRTFFKKKKLPITMNSMDIKPKFFNSKVKKILKDNSFLASAITMPYKKKIKKHVIINDKISKYANSVNFIIKIKKKIYGYNTDVYGALESIKKIKKSKIIIYGFGGSGEAIFRTLYRLYPLTKFNVVTTKIITGFNSKRVSFTKKIDRDFLSETELFINCSPLGSGLSKNYLKKSPLSKNDLKKLKPQATVFDIVYSPNKTRLNKFCKDLSINYLNGLKMNTEQANKALKIIEKNY